MSVSGIDLSYVKASVRPQDDLFEHINGQWLDSFDIPPDRGWDGIFRELRDQSELDVRRIVEELAAGELPDGADPHTAQLVAAIYTAFMDTERIESAGLAPLLPDLQAVEAAPNVDALAQVMGQLGRGGVGEAIATWVDTDPDNPNRYVINLAQSGLGLPDEAYYRDTQYEPVCQAYRQHLARLFGLVQTGLSDAGRQLGLLATVGHEEASARIYALEERLAAAHWDVVKNRDASATHNPMRLADLEELAPGFPWQGWTAALGGSRSTWNDLVVAEPSFFEALSQAWRQVDLADWQLWAAARVISARAPLLTEALVQANFDFNGKVLEGSEVIRERWKRGVSLVEGILGEAVGQIYTARHFPAANKARMSQLVANLVEAYRQSISSLDWMGLETKAKALAKLDAFTPKIGYPDKWRDYSALTLDPADLVGNVRAASAFETDRELGKIGRPVDRDEWFMTPQTVNAYYNPGMNEIVFPAAILQPPFFNMEADDAANYGGIGAVIGHEIGHGFDDQGSKYDGSGALVDWWTEDDRVAFDQRTKALIEQYNAFVVELPAGPMHVNGALTIGENIGDLGGLDIAWKAYLLALDGAAPPSIDGLDAAKRFFFGWAGCWRAKIRPELTELRLSTDPHSPDRFRCNGASRNLDLFYQAFEVGPGDGMYLAPKDRVSIW
ncbi:MAG: peptidase M13 [Micrococcales bacterium]|nr:peptidase M13 [Micrococcales bacterium]